MAKKEDVAKKASRGKRGQWKKAARTRTFVSEMALFVVVDRILGAIYKDSEHGRLNVRIEDRDAILNVIGREARQMSREISAR